MHRKQLILNTWVTGIEVFVEHFRNAAVRILVYDLVAVCQGYCNRLKI
jgi:hypothetical protein